jgi:hypothetical protein
MREDIGETICLLLEMPIREIDHFPVFAKPTQGQLIPLGPFGMPVNGFMGDINPTSIGRSSNSCRICSQENSE